MKIALIGLVAMVVALGLVEGVLRWRWGLGNPPLYVADVRMGYRLRPHQRLRRRGNRIVINAYSMRGDAIQPQPAPGTLRLLMLGDSVLNGNWWTDQPHILSQLVQEALVTQGEALQAAGYQSAEVLNASANSWGPRNQLGYVLRFGLFEANRVVVLLNTDDLFAIAPNSLQLNRLPIYPTRRPPLALVEVLGRLRKPRPIPELKALHDQPGDRVGVNLEALRQIHHRCQQERCQLLIAMTPLKRELGPDGPRDYELVARDRLRRFAHQQAIPYLDLLEPFNQAPDPAALYRDHIHLSPAGNDLVQAQITALVLGDLARPPIAPAPADAPASDNALAPDNDFDDLW